MGFEGCRKIRTALFLDGKIRPDGILIVEGDRVRTVGIDGENTGTEPSSKSSCEETAVPSAGVLVPGLADAHVHLRWPGDVEAAKAQGVTALRDLGSRSEEGFALVGEYPELRSCGSALMPPTGYGRFLGEPVRDLNDAAERMRRLAERGATFIKAIGSGIVQFGNGADVSPGGFCADELKAIVKRAREHGLKVSVHANGEPAVDNAVRAGAVSVEHGFFVSDETLTRMADRGTFWVPTVYALAALENPESGTSLSKAGHKEVRRLVKGHLRRLLQAFALGVPVALGTDAGSPGVGFGSGVMRELELWLSAGVSMDAALGATVTGSRRLAGQALPAFSGTPPPFLSLLERGPGVTGRLLAESGRWTGAGMDWLEKRGT